jgi:hypothetical protein
VAGEERVLGENQGEYLRAAIDQVMVSGDDNEAPARPEYPAPDEEE